MQIKTALLSLTAAILMATALTGCGSSSKEGMHANNVRSYGNQHGMSPYGTPYYNGNRHGDNYGNYRNFNTDGYGMNRNHSDNRYGYGMNGAGQYGMNGMNGYDRYNGAHMYGTGTMGNHNMGMHQSGKVEMSHKIANKIAALPGVHSANVMLTNNNAYVAVSTKHGTKMNTKGMSMRNANTATISGDMKAKIGAEVKKVAPNCKNVYVSADANFMDRMNEFSKMAKEGRPIHGFTTEFQEMVNRLFPSNNAPRANNYMAPGAHR